MIGPDGEHYEQMRLSDDPSFETMRLGPDARMTFESKLEDIQLPAVQVTINFDVSDYLSSHTDEEAWSFMAKLKDLFSPIPPHLPESR